MINFIKTWCEGITIAIFISVIIEMFVPQGNMKKYVSVIAGIYIIFSILSPVASNLDNINLNNFFELNENTQSTVSTNIDEVGNLYAVAIENEIKSEFEYIEDVKVILTENLDDIEKIEIVLLEEQSSLEDLREYLKENYNITEEKISIC